MFDSLPHDTTIEDLFCDDHALLSPLLQSTTNILTDTIQDEKGNNHFTYSNSNEVVNPSLIDKKILPQCKQIILHKSELPTNNHLTDVNNQLLEQLITETAIVEEQRNTINQLEREKMNLKGQIQILEQQTNQRK
jgi:hypothetical protein